MYQSKRLKYAIQFHHEAFNNCDKSTLLTAAIKCILPLWLLLKRANISKYVTETQATHMGHMQRIRQNLRSTRKEVPLYLQNLETEGINIKQEQKCGEVYLMVLDIRRMNGTINTDLTGAFLITSARGNKLIYIACSYEVNGILWEPMKSKNDSEMSRVFKTVNEKLENRGIKPKSHIMDNEASSTVMSWLEQKKLDAQKVSTHNHRANIAEIMIETAKHHFIAGMAGTDENYPIQEWDRGVAQSQRTLNILRPCRINPKLSADALLEGQHNYNDVPFPPPGMANADI